MPDRTCFLVGFPRSGTTWISNLINSHPVVVYRHELLGRCYAEFGEEIFRKLKSQCGLDDSEYSRAMEVALRAYPDTDRPPFFAKEHDKLAYPGVRRILWLIARKFDPIARLYSLAFTPQPGKELCLVIKETRSSVDLESIVRGMRTDKLIILIRHPYSVIASHVSGRKKGLMWGYDKDRKAQWYRDHKDVLFRRNRTYTLDDIIGMSDVEFLAVNWLLQNEEYLRIKDQFDDSGMVIVYEHFLANPRVETERVMGFLGLDMDEQVVQFIGETTIEETVSALRKDSSDDFYSVYRNPGFDPEKWRKVLSDDDIAAIDRHCLRFLQDLELFDASAVSS